MESSPRIVEPERRRGGAAALVDVSVEGAGRARRAFFIATGMPKSGNKWLNRMLFSLEGVGGYAKNPQRGMPLLAQLIWDEPAVRRFCRRTGRSFESVVRRLLDPGDEQWAPLSPAERSEIEPVLAGLATSARHVQAGGRRAGAECFAHLLGDDHDHDRDRIVHGRAALGLPGMHVAIGQIRAMLPDFRIVHLVRDPRDVVVSYFYHTLATLTSRQARQLFVRQRGDAVEMRPDWKRRFAAHARHRFECFFFGRPAEVRRTPLAYAAWRAARPFRTARPLGLYGPDIVEVRYESLLERPEDELDRVAAFLGVRATADERRAIAEANTFAARTRGGTAQGNAMMRKGVAGDWRTHFDRELLDALGAPFRRLVVELGYERDEQWITTLPGEPPEPFDFARFNVRRSTCRQFLPLWRRSPELQERYPDPWDAGEGATFHAWLREQDRADVVAWMRLSDGLERLWRSTCRPSPSPPDRS